MRVGLAFSIAGHLAIIAYGLVAFPGGRTFKVDDIETFSVELVPIAELTDLEAGDRKAEKTPEAPAQPEPNLKAEAPSPEPAEKPAKVPVKVAETPAPEILAALPKAVEPEPPAPAEVEPDAAEVPPSTPAQKPRARPKPPKPVKVARSAEPKKPDKPSFNPDEIAALLNKQDPAGGGDPTPAARPRTFGADDGRIDAAMTQSEQDAIIGALRNRLAQCWNPPRGVREAGGLRVTVSIGLLPDGSLAAEPRIVEAGLDSLSRIAAESAIRAVRICAPYDMLPPEKYSAWRNIEFIFDPREMLGG